MKGTVSRISEKEWNGKTLFSIQLVNDPTYYGMGTTQPMIKVGDYVDFDTTVTGNGRVNVRNNSIMVLKEGTEAPVVTQARTGGGFKPRFQKDEGKDAYWKNREERDVKVQERIQFQSARNSAIAFLDVLLKNNAVKLPEAPAKRYDVVAALLDEITERFNKPNVDDSSPPDAAEGLELVEETVGNDMAGW